MADADVFFGSFIDFFNQFVGHFTVGQITISQLTTVARQFFLKGGNGVQFYIVGVSHFDFKFCVEVQIFLQRCFAKICFCAIGFAVNIIELGKLDRFAVDGEKNGVSLSKSGEGKNQKSDEQRKCLIHFVYFECFCLTKILSEKLFKIAKILRG